MSSRNALKLMETMEGTAARAVHEAEQLPLLEEQLQHDAARGVARAALFRRLLALGDAAAGGLAGAAGAFAAQLDRPEAIIFTFAVLVAWPLLVFVSGLYAVDGLNAWASGVSEVARLAGLGLLLSWPLAGMAVLLGAGHPLAAGGVGTPVVLVLALAGRGLVRGALHRSPPLRQRTLIVGSGMVAAQIAARLLRHEEFGLEPVGLVDDDVHQRVPVDLPQLGRIGDLREVIEDHGIDRVIIAFTRASHEELLDCMRACRELRVAVDVVPRLFEFLDGARSLEQIGGVPLLSIGVPRLSRSSRAAKRVLDIVLSALALVVLLPLLVFVAVAIKLESRGPVFFRQTRAGQGGKTFQLIKFRSMYADADARKGEVASLNDQTDGVMFKIHRDPRVSRVGRVLRRLSLDELPQFLNVLTGEMSIVGPRPLILPEHEMLSEDWQIRRLDLRPGLTGPWQISGRSDLTVRDMVRMDFQYVTGWSLARDLEIMLATVPAVLVGRGAY
jgi:exopolysaccharide biosynthesis polyprenyl glycosylphosphotransferase